MRRVHLAVFGVGLGLLQACGSSSDESPPPGGGAGGSTPGVTPDGGGTPRSDAGAPEASTPEATSPSLDGAVRSDAATAEGATSDAPSGTTPDGTTGCVPYTSNVDAGPTTIGNLVPVPAAVTSAGGRFLLSSGASIRVDTTNAEMTAIGEYLGAKLRPSTGYALPVASESSPCAGDIILRATGAQSTNAEAYDLTITPTQVTLSGQPAGVFRGLQTLRQLLPPSIESKSAAAMPWIIPTGTINDFPRFAWRGAMLDVARHFFSPQDVRTYIDLIAYYKINMFHIHLSDDQGWRIAITSRPLLTTVGGASDFDGPRASVFYSQADYTGIVNYAKSQYITVMPEIDMPGHSNAALASYPDLYCAGVRVDSLCATEPTTYTYVRDVINEISAITPGPYFHIGGDEASNTSAADFRTFFAQVMPFVQSAGKQLVGWDAIGQLTIAPNVVPAGSIIQFWDPNSAMALTNARDAAAAGRDVKVLVSVANKAYLDMKYDNNTTFGQTWAGLINEQVAYDWDPVTITNDPMTMTSLTDAQIAGVESPLWTETLRTLADLEYMAFPRIAGHAEIGWSRPTGRNWDEYRVRIGSHGPRLRALGVNYYPGSPTAPLIPWQQ